MNHNHSKQEQGQTCVSGLMYVWRNNETRQDGHDATSATELLVGVPTVTAIKQNLLLDKEKLHP